MNGKQPVDDKKEYRNEGLHIYWIDCGNVFDFSCFTHQTE